MPPPNRYDPNQYRRPIANYKSIRRKFKNVSDIKPEYNIVLYGKAGTGKTTLACTFPKPILILDVNEDGTDSVRDQKDIMVMKCSEYSEAYMVYWWLKKERHNFKTVVIDTISQLQDLCLLDHMTKIRRGKAINSGRLGMWGAVRRQDYGAVASEMKNFVTDFKNLPLNTIFVAHNRVFTVDEEDEDEDGNETINIDPEIGPRLMPSIKDHLDAAVGVIGNTFIRQRIIKKGKRHTKKVEYSLRIGPNPVYVTKIRKPLSVALPDAIVNPSYQKLKGFIEDAAAQIKASTDDKSGVARRRIVRRRIKAK